MKMQARLLAVALLLLVFESLEVTVYLAKSFPCFIPVVSNSWGLPIRFLTQGGTIVLLLSALDLLLAKRVALSAALGATTLLVFTLCDERYYSNHVFLACILLFFFALANTSPHRVGGFYHRCICVQASIVYLATAFAKCNSSYLSGAILKVYFERSFFELSIPSIEVLQLLAISSIAFELTLGLSLWIPRYKKAALQTGVLFHAILALFSPIDQFFGVLCFSFLMFASYLSFQEIVHRPLVENDAA
ncbi:MAG: hypothetical protein KDD64_02120 [Bdellovibrionales bacterium]|nr:hypothetical protein [Bdellovibrionales bacterium]